MFLYIPFSSDKDPEDKDFKLKDKIMNSTTATASQTSTSQEPDMREMANAIRFLNIPDDDYMLNDFLINSGFKSLPKQYDMVLELK